MKVIIMRGAKTASIKSALSKTPTSISSEGIKSCQLVARFLKSIDLIPDKIITSSLKRSVQTGEHIAEALDIKALKKSTNLIPGGNSTDLLKTVKNHCDDIDLKEAKIMVIIHNPDMRKILGELMFPDTEFQFRILSGDVCVLDIIFDDVKVISRLCSYFSPYLLKGE